MDMERYKRTLIAIPDFLRHLKVSRHGYPVPFFVAYRDGQPDFRLLDKDKQYKAGTEHLCGICGKKLHKDYFYFTSGILGMCNKVSSDPAMHRDCAEYSLKTCPHLRFQKAERRDTGIDTNEFQNELIDLDKPEMVFLIRASKYKFKLHEEARQYLFHYRYEGHQCWKYEDGILVASLGFFRFTDSELEVHKQLAMQKIGGV